MTGDLLGLLACLKILNQDGARFFQNIGELFAQLYMNFAAKQESI